MLKLNLETATALTDTQKDNQLKAFKAFDAKGYGKKINDLYNVADWTGELDSLSFHLYDILSDLGRLIKTGTQTKLLAKFEKLSLIVYRLIHVVNSPNKDLTPREKSVYVKLLTAIKLDLRKSMLAKNLATASMEVAAEGNKANGEYLAIIFAILLYSWSYKQGRTIVGSGKKDNRREDGEVGKNYMILHRQFMTKYVEPRKADYGPITKSVLSYLSKSMTETNADKHYSASIYPVKVQEKLFDRVAGLRKLQRKIYEAGYAEARLSSNIQDEMKKQGADGELIDYFSKLVKLGPYKHLTPHA